MVDGAMSDVTKTGKPRRRWIYDIENWTGLNTNTAAENSKRQT